MALPTIVSPPLTVIEKGKALGGALAFKKMAGGASRRANEEIPQHFVW